MNKKILIGSIGAIIIALGGGYWYTSGLEKKIEARTMQDLAKYNVKVSDVQHCMLTGTTTLTDVAFSTIYDDTTFSLTADKFAIEDPDPKILTRTDDLPRVFDGIAFEGLKMEVSNKLHEMNITYSVAYAETGAYYQNIAKIIESFETKPWSEEFFTNVLTYEIKDCEYALADANMQQNGKTYMQFKIEEAYGTMPEIGQQNGAVKGIEFMVTANIDATTTIDAFEFEFEFSPEFYGEILAIAAKALLQAQGSQELTAQLGDALLKMPNVNTAFQATGIKVAIPEIMPNSDLFSIKSIETKQQVNDIIENSVKMNELVLTKETINLIWQNLTGMPDELVTSFNMQTTVNPENSDITYNVEVDNTLLNIKTDMAFNMEWPLSSSSDIDDITFTSARTQVEDKGLLPIVFVFLQKMTNTPVPLLIDQSKTTLQSLPSPETEGYDIMVKLSAALIEMLYKPGTLDVAIKFDTPFPLESMELPEDYTFKAETKQGNKTLLDLTEDLVK